MGLCTEGGKFFFLLLLLLTTLPFFLQASLQLSFLVSSTDYKRLCWTNQFRSFFFQAACVCVFLCAASFLLRVAYLSFFSLLLFSIVYFEKCERLNNRASFKCINSEREGKKTAGTTSLFDQLYALSLFFYRASM